MKKKIVSLLSIFLIICVIIPFGLKWYGCYLIEEGIEQTREYQYSEKQALDKKCYKGWSYLDAVAYFPLWGTSAQNYQKYSLLQFEILFLENYSKHQSQLASILREELDVKLEKAWFSYVYIDSMTKVVADEKCQEIRDSFYHWQEERKGTADGLPSCIQESAKVINDTLNPNILVIWEPYEDWIKADSNRKIIDFERFSHEMPIEKYLSRLQVKLSVEYITKGY